MAVHLSTGPLKPRCGLELVARCEPIIYNSLTDDLAIALSRSVRAAILATANFIFSYG